MSFATSMLPIQAELSEVIAVTVGSLILYPPAISLHSRF